MILESVGVLFEPIYHSFLQTLYRALSLSTWGILTTEETVKEAGKVSSFPCAEDEGAFVSSHSLPHSHRVRCFLKDRSRIC